MLNVCPHALGWLPRRDLLDTTDATPDGTAAAVAAWLGEHAA